MSGEIFFKGISRLSLKLQRILLSDEIEKINANGFKSFSFDVMTCESKQYPLSYLE